MPFAHIFIVFMLSFFCFFYASVLYLYFNAMPPYCLFYLFFYASGLYHYFYAMSQYCLFSLFFYASCLCLHFDAILSSFFVQFFCLLFDFFLNIVWGRWRHILTKLIAFITYSPIRNKLYISYPYNGNPLSLYKFWWTKLKVISIIINL